MESAMVLKKNTSGMLSDAFNSYILKRNIKRCRKVAKELQINETCQKNTIRNLIFLDEFNKIKRKLIVGRDKENGNILKFKIDDKNRVVRHDEDIKGTVVEVNFKDTKVYVYNYNIKKNKINGNYIEFISDDKGEHIVFTRKTAEIPLFGVKNYSIDKRLEDFVQKVI